MSPNEMVIQKFYTAFANKDFKSMCSCYSEDVIFNDPAFKDLNHKEVCGMWQMLLERGKDLEIEFSEIKAKENSGSARWIATYTFGRTGRKVVNDIRANFEFRDNLITSHTDSFDFHNWSSQALGITGKLLGWTGFFQKKVSTGAMDQLHRFLDRNK